ncbi:hypothetical protein [Halpernia sp. GG3]
MTEVTLIDGNYEERSNALELIFRAADIFISLRNNYYDGCSPVVIFPKL